MPTKINYLDETWNPITGCSGKGCKAHCWARDMVKRFSHLHVPKQRRETYTGDDLIPFEHIQFHPDRLDNPLHWRKPRRIGVCFLGDLFDEQAMNMGQNPGERIFQVVDIMLIADHHKYFVLTKQPVNMAEWHKEWIWNLDITDHIYWGVTITEQDDADTKIPELLRVPGKKWLSIEPMLSEIELLDKWYCPQCNQPNSQIQWMCPICKGDRFVNRPDWVVVGCESGPRRRPCPLEWVDSVVEQCKAAGVPVWVKQLDIGGHVVHDIDKFPEHLRIRERP